MPRPPAQVEASNATLTNNTFANSISMDRASNLAMSGVMISNNGVNGLLMDGGTLSGTRLWDDPDIVYRDPISTWF